MDRITRLKSLLTELGWLEGAFELEFLAAGEYNENFILRRPEPKPPLVFRINHGSQLDLPPDRQILYEHSVLSALSESGVTPRPYQARALSRSLRDEVGDGVLLMEWLPGRSLDYRSDSECAAVVFAAVHSQSVSDELLVQADPIDDIVAECERLLSRYTEGHPLEEKRGVIQSYMDRVRRLAEEHRDELAAEPLSIVNTEVNSGNFIVGDEGCYLVDWEKAVVSSIYQDLGHFLVSTTTLWKTDFTFSEEERRGFLEAYRRARRDYDPGFAADIDELSAKAKLLERTILLRAFSWSFMAYFEYTQLNRGLQNTRTFETIGRYLREIDWFLR
jgi:hypothetical protein